MEVVLSLLACTVLLAGCNTSSESNEEQPLKVYSFSGENEHISVSNGVIILDGKDEICYGGDLKAMSDDFTDITTYSLVVRLYHSLEFPLFLGSFGNSSSLKSSCLWSLKCPLAVLVYTTLSRIDFIKSFFN